MSVSVRSHSSTTGNKEQIRKQVELHSVFRDILGIKEFKTDCSTDVFESRAIGRMLDNFAKVEEDDWMNRKINIAVLGEDSLHVSSLIHALTGRIYSRVFSDFCGFSDPEQPQTVL